MDMLSEEFALYAVMLTRSDGTRTFACGADSPVAMYFKRESAINFAHELVARGIVREARPVRVHAKIDQVRRPKAARVR